MFIFFFKLNTQTQTIPSSNTFFFCFFLLYLTKRMILNYIIKKKKRKIFKKIVIINKSLKKKKKTVSDIKLKAISFDGFIHKPRQTSPRRPSSSTNHIAHLLSTSLPPTCSLCSSPKFLSSTSSSYPWKWYRRNDFLVGLSFIFSVYSQNASFSLFSCIFDAGSFVVVIVANPVKYLPGKVSAPVKYLPGKVSAR